MSVIRQEVAATNSRTKKTDHQRHENENKNMQH
mgnify:CR=1 FL=1